MRHEPIESIHAFLSARFPLKFLRMRAWAGFIISRPSPSKDVCLLLAKKKKTKGRLFNRRFRFASIHRRRRIGGGGDSETTATWYVRTLLYYLATGYSY